MEKTLRFLDESGNLITEILSFTYNSKRMGGAPSITATLYSFTQLDFSGNEYAIFNGSRYNLKSLPSSEKNNTDARYKYNITLTHEREKLDNIYFIDSISSQDANGRRVTNSTEFFFTGTIKDLVDRYNAILSKANLGYTIEIDQSIVGGDISKESRDISFDKKFWSEAIQEIYNAFEIPYYFVGTTCHVGYNDNGAIEGIVKYGADNALLSVRKENKNNKVVTRVTGEGSSENIPYYYPNLTPTGDNSIDPTGKIQASDIKSINWEVLSGITNLRDGATLTYRKASPIADKVNYMAIAYKPYGIPPGVSSWTAGVFYKSDIRSISDAAEVHVVSSDPNKSYSLSTKVYFYVEKDIPTTLTFKFGIGKYIAAGTTYQKEIDRFHLSSATVYVGETRSYDYSFKDGEEPTTLTFTPKKTGLCEVQFYGNIYVDYSSNPDGGNLPYRSFVNLSWSPFVVRDVNLTDYVSIDDTERTFPIDDTGIVFNNPDSIVDGSILKITETKNWIPPQKCLMPSIYRGTLGEERFYNAKNEKYVTETNVKYTVEKPTDVTYETEFDKNRYKEHIISFDYIKPTIKEMTNDSGERIDIFKAFAYDTYDNDEVDDKNNYKHPFFFAKLRKLPFNLFSQAIEGGTMTISMTTGPCAGCNFEIAVDDKSQKNLVQVDSDGNLKRVDGDVLCGREGQSVVSPQSAQNDTTKNEVWVALRKDDSAYGVVMPNVAQKVRPNAIKDEFVITNILLPNEYILAAEKKLEEETLRYMSMNNADQFNFSIKFSRIFLQENDEFRNHLDENARVRLEYHGSQLDLYVSEFTYKVVDNEAIPEILVSITDTLAVQSTAMQHIVSEVKSEVITEATKVDIMPTLARVALRKDKDDSSPNSIAVKSISTIEDATIGGEANVGGDTNIGGAAKVEGTVEAKSGVTVGDYSTALGNTRGARISDVGDADFRSIRANYLEVFTLLYNQIQASSAYTVFDDTATIIGIAQEGGQLALTFEGNEEYVQPFEVGDILHGYVNKLNNLEYSVSGECWLKVTETPSDSNALTNNQVAVVLYSDEQVPSGKNLTPTKNMVLAHRGNVDDNKKHRQHTFYISSRDGNIIQLMDVNSPMLLNIDDGYSNYGVVVGQLPKDLFDYVYKRYSFIRPNDPIVYAKYLAVQNLLQLDYLGRPIMTERYRGAWSKEVAMSDDPYMVTPTTYDTVTHKGLLWICNVPNTTVEPSSKVTEWTKKTDISSSAIYEIKPVPNIMYVSDGKLTNDTLTVKVGETSSDGYKELVTESELSARGLRLQYAIDGAGDRVDLNISLSGLFELEDGSGSITTEDGVPFALEGDSIDVESIKKEIVIYLVDSNGTDVATYVIPVVKDGENGKDGKDGVSPYTIIATPPNINVLVNANDGSIISDVETAVYIYVKKGTSDIEPTMYYVDADEFETNSATQGIVKLINPIAQSGNKRWRVKIRINKGSYKQSDIPSLIRVKVFDKYATDNENNPLLIGYADFTPSISQRGLVGPAGETGPLPYACGEWHIDGIYPAATDITPYVYYNGQYYVRTSNPLRLDAGGYPLDPATDYSQGGAYAWRVMSYYESLYVKLLMANWARFGGKNGAVFFGEYMFSSKGVANGVPNIDHDAYVDDKSGNTPMFNSEGLLSGSFVPNLFLDLLRGAIKTDKFSETFRDFREEDCDGDDASADYLDYSNGYNLIIKGQYAKLVCMPLTVDITNGAKVLVKSLYEPDGVHSTIIMPPDINYEKNVAYSLRQYAQDSNWKGKGGYTFTDILTKSCILCADPRIVNKYSYRYNGEGSIKYAPYDVAEYTSTKTTSTTYYGSYGTSGSDFSDATGQHPNCFFVVNGVFSKFLIIEPGTTVSMRSATVPYYSNSNKKYYDVHVWIVDNGSDFEQLRVKIMINLKEFYNQTTGNIEQHNGYYFTRWGTIGEGNNDDFYPDLIYNSDDLMGAGRIFGTKRMRRFYDYYKGDDSLDQGYSLEITPTKDGGGTFIDEIDAIRTL